MYVVKNHLKTSFLNRKTCDTEVYERLLVVNVLNIRNNTRIQKYEVITCWVLTFSFKADISCCKWKKLGKMVYSFNKIYTPNRSSYWLLLSLLWKLWSSVFKLTFIPASALLAMRSIYIGQLLGPAAAPLIMCMRVHLGGVAMVCYYPHPALCIILQGMDITEHKPCSLMLTHTWFFDMLTIELTIYITISLYTHVLPYIHRRHYY